jgi:hypothetical protein
MVEDVLGAPHIFLSDGDQRLHFLQILQVGAFDIFLDRNFSRCGVFVGFDLSGECSLVNARLSSKLFFNARRIQLDDFLIGRDDCAVGNDPENRAAAGNLAFHVDVAGTFQLAVVIDRNDQILATDRVSHRFVFS